MINLNWIRSTLSEYLTRRNLSYIYIINDDTNDTYKINPLNRPKTKFKQGIFEFQWADRAYVRGIEGYQISKSTIRSVRQITYIKNEIVVYCGDQDLRTLNDWHIEPKLVD